MRELVDVITSRPSRDGDGVSIQRLAGERLHDALNPFLLIDEIRSEEAQDYIGGFPEHPHRGFETITYMKAGRMRHKDHLGNNGVIGAGDVQWMTAGAGVLHSEMPEQEQGLLHGFQIWLNLPAIEKMKPAAYQELLKAEITQKQLPNGGHVRLIAGEIAIGQQLLNGPLISGSTEAVLADVTLTPYERLDLTFDANNSAKVYVYDGRTDSIESHQLGIYSTGDILTLQAGEQGAGLLVLSGGEIEEPVVQYGPFVMNTKEEIELALRDFRNPDFLDQLE